MSSIRFHLFVLLLIKIHLFSSNEEEVEKNSSHGEGSGEEEDALPVVARDLKDPSRKINADHSWKSSHHVGNTTEKKMRWQRRKGGRMREYAMSSPAYWVLRS